MTLQEAVTILETYQRWRLGAEIQMEEPKVVTKALDVALAYLLEVVLEQLKLNDDISIKPNDSNI
jgi:hypothetical protein